MAAEPERVALLPFKINAEKDLTFLQNGIFDMLSSRLADPGKVVVLSRAEIDTALAGTIGPQDEATARKLGQTLSANYVLFGSLTMFGDSLSIDAKMTDVSGAETAGGCFHPEPGYRGDHPVDRPVCGRHQRAGFRPGDTRENRCRRTGPRGSTTECQGSVPCAPGIALPEGHSPRSPRLSTRNDLLPAVAQHVERPQFQVPDQRHDRWGRG